MVRACSRTWFYERVVTWGPGDRVWKNAESSRVGVAWIGTRVYARSVAWNIQEIGFDSKAGRLKGWFSNGPPLGRGAWPEF